jgi:hypothetical protein
LAAGAALSLLALTGCQVHTQISLNETGPGRGVIRVSVSLDQSALAAIGGASALTAQLQDADLVAAGWAVTAPGPGPGSTTVVSASHGFTSAAQASALVAELAGSGPAANRPFRLSLTQQHGFWRTDTALTGTVDLSCRIDCFGDSGLATALGFPTGVNPGSLAAAAGERPDQVFTFSMDARLRGSLVSTNGIALSDGALQWEPRLGQRLELAAVTRTWRSGRIVAVSVTAGVVLLVALGGAIYWWWRRRRRRRRGRHRRGARRLPEAVAPPS